MAIIMTSNSLEIYTQFHVRNVHYTPLKKCFNGLSFGLTNEAFLSLQNQGTIDKGISLRDYATIVFKGFRMRNDFYRLRFIDVKSGFQILYESEIEDIHKTWDNYASMWCSEINSIFDEAKMENRKTNYWTYHYFQGKLAISSQRNLYDRILINLAINNRLNFSEFNLRYKVLSKNAEANIKRYAKRFNLLQIIDTSNLINPTFSNIQ
ncbi:TPA: hypothetical protein ACGIK9_003276 [Acinetobacter baumannii]|uniref:hypothetical protein n=1 Tax=Acinetobacter baumannii TaxID=470 RepID=UPI00338E9686